MRLALATAIEHVGRDDDLPPLLDACAARGIDTVVRGWDDASVEWSRFDLVLVRSTWNYTQCLPQFLRWSRHVAARTRLLNPPDVLAWNTDKHYLADLAARGVAVVPTAFVEPEQDPLATLQAFLAGHDADAFVVKPAVGAGSHDAQRYARDQAFAAANHLGRLLGQGRSAMLQPYFPSVDHAGETGLVYFAGEFSHAIGKAARLHGDGGDAATAPEPVVARVPAPDERELAARTLAAAAAHLGHAAPFTYARVDLIRDAAGKPCVLELELCEPSLFLVTAPGAAERLAAVLAQPLIPDREPGR
jgi:O-ureido-D-serine cyclo-ligase